MLWTITSTTRLVQWTLPVYRTRSKAVLPKHFAQHLHAPLGVGKGDDPRGSARRRRVRDLEFSVWDLGFGIWD